MKCSDEPKHCKGQEMKMSEHTGPRKLRGVKTEYVYFPHSTLAAMQAYGAPLTREEFLNWEFMGEVPEVIDAELEQTFPREFRSNYEED